MTPSHRFLAIAAILTQSACSGQGVRVSEPAPAAPEAAVTAFLAAVNSNDVARMAQLWGTDRGPSPVVIRNTQERERRLVVMQRVLLHDAFQFLAAPSDQVAWWAHVGGMVAGAILILVMRRPGVPLFDRGLQDTAAS